MNPPDPKLRARHERFESLRETIQILGMDPDLGPIADPTQDHIDQLRRQLARPVQPPKADTSGITHGEIDPGRAAEEWIP